VRSSAFGYSLPTILIVDDSAFNRFALTELLQEFNVAVDEAADGQEAINKMIERDAIGGMYRLAIIEVEMPGMSGLETTQNLH